MPSVKNIGKPCAGKPHARFDEEGLVKLTMEWLLRHRQTKGAETDKQLLMAIEGLSFTLPRLNHHLTFHRELTYGTMYITAGCLFSLPALFPWKNNSAACQ